MRRILASLIAVFVCLMAMGQAFTPLRPFIPLLSSQTAEAGATVGLWFRWVYSDIDTNNATITTWPDRMHSWNLLPDGASGPMNTSTGVIFTPSNYLTNDSFPLWSNIACGLILYMTDATGGGGIRPSLIQINYNTDGGNMARWGFNFNSYNIEWQQQASFTSLGTAPWNINTQWCTLVLGQVRTALGTGDYCYTNNALSATQTLSGSIIFGSSGPPSMPSVLGHNPSRNTGPYFTLKEYWVWTNTAGDLIPYSVISNFYVYATNTYHFTTP